MIVPTGRYTILVTSQNLDANFGAIDSFVSSGRADGGDYSEEKLAMVLRTLMNAKMSDQATARVRLATSNLATLKTKLMPRSAMAIYLFFHCSFMEVLDSSNLTGECNSFELQGPSGYRAMTNLIANRDQLVSIKIDLPCSPN